MKERALQNNNDRSGGVCVDHVVSLAQCTNSVNATVCLGEAVGPVVGIGGTAVLDVDEGFAEAHGEFT